MKISNFFRVKKFLKFDDLFYNSGPQGYSDELEDIDGTQRCILAGFSRDPISGSQT